MTLWGSGVIEQKKEKRERTHGQGQQCHNYRGRVEVEEDIEGINKMKKNCKKEIDNFG